MSILILGHTGNIGQPVSDYFKKSQPNISVQARVDKLPDIKYDAIINCVGYRGNLNNVFEITRHYDGIIFNYLKNRKETIVISFSSGIVGMKENNCDYKSAKIESEEKHRASSYRIIDIRLFNFFSRFSNLDEPYFINDAVKCARDGRVFVTPETNFVRDYISADDLGALIMKSIEYGKNDCFEAFGLSPTTKLEIISKFRDKLGLKIKYDNNEGRLSPTGEKNVYIPSNFNAIKIGYTPRFTSLDAILAEAEGMVKNVD